MEKKTAKDLHASYYYYLCRCVANGVTLPHHTHTVAAAGLSPQVVVLGFAASVFRTSSIDHWVYAKEDGPRRIYFIWRSIELKTSLLVLLLSGSNSTSCAVAGWLEEDNYGLVAYL